MNPHANKKSFIALSAAENVMWSQRQGLTDKVSTITAKVGWFHQAASDKLNEMEKWWSAKPSNAAETPPPLPHQAYYSQSLCRFVFFTELSLVTNVTDEQKVHKFTGFHFFWDPWESSQEEERHTLFTAILKPSAADTNWMDSFSCLEFKNKQKAVERYWKTLRNEC